MAKKTDPKTETQPDPDAERREAEVTHRPTEFDQPTVTFDEGLPSETIIEERRQAEERNAAQGEAARAAREGIEES